MNYDEDAPFEVKRYREMQKALPGADALYQLVQASLETELPDGGQVLIAGAGGGREVECLANSRIPYILVGFDPSEDMLSMARWYLDVSARPDSATLVQGLVTDVTAPEDRFHGGTALLVMHFLPDDATPRGKAAFLRGMRDRLRYGAPFLLADVSVDAEVMFSDLSEIFVRHAMLSGLDAVEMSKAPTGMASLPTVSAARTQDLLLANGFRAPTLIFQTLWYRAWLSFAV